MASTIQRLVAQARTTFCKRGTDPGFSEELKRLKELVSSVWERRAHVAYPKITTACTYACVRFSTVYVNDVISEEVRIKPSPTVRHI